MICVPIHTHINRNTNLRKRYIKHIWFVGNIGFKLGYDLLAPAGIILFMLLVLHRFVFANLGFKSRFQMPRVSFSDLICCRDARTQSHTIWISNCEGLGLNDKFENLKPTEHFAMIVQIDKTSPGPNWQCTNIWSSFIMSKPNIIDLKDFRWNFVDVFWTFSDIVCSQHYMHQKGWQKRSMQQYIGQQAGKLSGRTLADQKNVSHIGCCFIDNHGICLVSNEWFKKESSMPMGAGISDFPAKPTVNKLFCPSLSFQAACCAPFCPDYHC